MHAQLDKTHAPQHFGAIEGLRGWLAWTVVISHIVFASNAYAKGLYPSFIHAGNISVFVFVIISGFVITHLLMQNQETYGQYIFRRFMRIFPLFAITTAAGNFADPLLLAALSKEGNSAHFPLLRDMIASVHSQREFFWQNFVAHIVILHGAISDNIIPRAAYVFNGPAWSLSLEWQFYITAPVVLAYINSRRIIAASLFACAAVTLYHLGAFGSFSLPSILFGATPLFAVGIGSRLVLPMLSGRLNRGQTVLAACLVALVSVFDWHLFPLGIWSIVFLGLVDTRSAIPAINAALTNRVALFFGKRSYSIYLCHWPLLGLIMYVAQNFAIDPLTPAQIVLVLVGFLIPATGLAAIALYITVERPGIILGNLVIQRYARARVLKLAA